ncbi:hypothetical protein LI328DRAFT_32413 [Trichoderma asperelloides]|nr:hypothetical protein LI328DRAFT_32413 [Trichoderma asperelloides]
MYVQCWASAHTLAAAGSGNVLSSCLTLFSFQVLSVLAENPVPRSVQIGRLSYFVLLPSTICFAQPYLPLVDQRHA